MTAAPPPPPPGATVEIRLNGRAVTSIFVYKERIIEDRRQMAMQRSSSNLFSFLFEVRGPRSRSARRNYGLGIPRKLSFPAKKAKKRFLGGII